MSNNSGQMTVPCAQIDEKPRFSGVFCCQIERRSAGFLGNAPQIRGEMAGPGVSLYGSPNQVEIKMNKSEFVAAVAEKADMGKGDAAKAVDAVFDVITSELASGGDVRMTGFGNFSITHRAESKGRNPSTGAEITIPAAKRPKFTAGKALKDAVNK
jgi:DNA-binding protein HU-beta